MRIEEEKYSDFCIKMSILVLVQKIFRVLDFIKFIHFKYHCLPFRDVRL